MKWLFIGKIINRPMLGRKLYIKNSIPVIPFHIESFMARSKTIILSTTEIFQESGQHDRSDVVVNINGFTQIQLSKDIGGSDI